MGSLKTQPKRPRATGLQPVTRRSFCSARLPTDRSPGRFQVQDLGDQTIEGVDARGQSITMPVQGMTAGEESPNGERTSELWCSDSLSAIVLTVAGNTKTGVKSTVAMRNIERSEPDPALFQIRQTTPSPNPSLNPANAAIRMPLRTNHRRNNRSKYRSIDAG